MIDLFRSDSGEGVTELQKKRFISLFLFFTSVGVASWWVKGYETAPSFTEEAQISSQ